MLGVALVAALATSTAGARSAAVPRFTTYPTSGAQGDRAGEPSVAVSWRSEAVILQAGLETLKLVPSGSYQDVGTFTTSQVSLDPVAFADSATGRVFVSQLTAVGSLMAWSDNDGRSWSVSQGSGLPAGIDHQSVGGGPYPPESTARPSGRYPHAVYYCSQDVYAALCARSDDGGTTFGPGVPIWTGLDCDGLHGHVKVAYDGTVYVPNAECGTRQGVAVSRDAGLTWTIRRVPDASPGELGDPSIGLGRDGTAYFAYVDADGAVRVSTSRNRGVSWTPSRDIGAPVGIANAAMPTAVAGDGDRAAVAYLGTRTAGDSQDDAFGKDSSGVRYAGSGYHLYVAMTYDRGRTWTTTDVTGSDPVQRGWICMAGTTCGDARNLLDFIDVGVDRLGRVLVAWADGCTGACARSNLVAANTHTSRGVISRQSSGPGLFRTPPRLAR
jgi:hypothetical protein